jgi:hypothetical protein
MDGKRKRRSESPDDAPMAPDIKSIGFLAESARLLIQHKNDSKKLSSESAYLLEQVVEYFAEHTVDAHTGDYATVVQLVNTLFEVAAAVTNLARACDDDEADALDALHNHALSGLRLIGPDGGAYDEVLD